MFFLFLLSQTLKAEPLNAVDASVATRGRLYFCQIIVQLKISTLKCGGFKVNALNRPEGAKDKPKLSTRTSRSFD